VLIPWLDKLLSFLEGKTGSSLPPYNPGYAWPIEGANKGSNNHEAQAWTGECLRAWLARDGRFQAAKRVLLTAYYPREMGLGDRGVGLQGAEQNCPSSHDAQHRNGTSFFRLVAWLSQDAELLAASETLLLTTVRAKLCIASSDLTVCGPGFRCPGKPIFAGDTAWLRVALGRDPRVRKGIENDQFYVGVRALQYLSKMKEPDPVLAQTARMTLQDMAPCVLKYPMDVVRGDGWYFAQLVGDKNQLPSRDTCDWVYCRDGQQPEFSSGWNKPRPFPLAKSSVIHFPGISEGRRIK